LSQQDEMLADLTSGVFNSVHARLSDAARGSVSGYSGMKLGMGSMPMRLGGGSHMNLGTEDISPRSSNNAAAFWAQAFGGARDEDASGVIGASEHELAGGIAGVDGTVMPRFRLGAFVGGSHANLETSYNTQELDTDSYFAGLYASTRQNRWFANGMLTSGQSEFESSRDVLNNLVSNGIQTANASYNGTFISPEVTLGAALPIGGGLVIEPSVRGRYAFLSIDSYTETGASDSLMVGGRDISLWLGRAQLAFSYASEAGRIAPRIGVEGWMSDDDAISAVLIGQAISFNAGGDDEVTGFIGATATSHFGGLSAFVDGEVHVGEDGFGRAEARAGIAMNF
jgi:outer membrane autotransporter protein